MGVIVCFLQNVIDGAGSDSKLAGCFGNCAQMAYKDITIIVIENDATLPMHHDDMMQGIRSAESRGIMIRLAGRVNRISYPQRL